MKNLVMVLSCICGLCAQCLSRDELNKEFEEKCRSISYLSCLNTELNSLHEWLDAHKQDLLLKDCENIVNNLFEKTPDLFYIQEALLEMLLQHYKQ